MTARRILSWPDTSLHRVCEPIAEFDDSLRALIDDMQDTLNVNYGAGLAAPQIGFPVRVVILKQSCFVDDIADADDMLVMINPEMTVSGEFIKSNEACLSVPYVDADVDRHENVSVRFQDIAGEWHTMECGWPLSAGVQHECDHLDGVLFLAEDKQSKTKYMQT